MKYIKNIFLGLSLLALTACVNDDFDFEGSAISFYPTVVDSGFEEDGNTYILSLETAGFIEGTATATIVVDMTAEGIISTVPPMVNNRIQVELTNTNQATILVTIENDQIPDDYLATFRIMNVGGELAGIGRDKFTLFVEDKDFVPYVSENFNLCDGSDLASFTTYSVVGAQVWECVDGFGLGGTNGARMNGFSGSSIENEDWLISPTYDLTALDIAAVSFYSDRRFAGPDIQLKVSTNYGGSGNPNDATWTTLEPTLDTQDGEDTWTFSGYVNIDDYLTANTTFALVYFSSTSAASRWTVDQFEVNLFNPNASGGGNDNLAILPFTDDFEACTTDFNTPSNWDEYFTSVKDDNGFGCRPFGVDDSRGVRVSSFNGEVGVIDTWLISKNKFDLRSMPSGTLLFDARSATAGNGTMEVLYSTNYFREGPALASWTVLDVADQLPVKGSNTYTSVTTNVPGGSILYIAFRFSGGSESNSASYDIDNISFTPYEFGTLPFSEDFAGCGDAETFNIPSGWREVNIPGTKTDRGWGCNDFGRTGTGMRASAFGGSVGNDDAWLISDGKFNFTDLTNVTLKFWVEDRFVGPGELEVKWSSDYDGSGNPNSFTWTTLADVDAQLPADNSAAYKEITSSLNAAAGQQVYLAFRYYQGTNSAAGAFTLDDISITGN